MHCIILCIGGDKLDIQLKKGLLELCILASLQEKESYGYQIIKDVEPYIEISESTLYPILKRLEKNECLRSYSKEYNGRLRKYYAITEKGTEKLKNAQDDYLQLKKIYAFILGGEVHE